MTLVVVNSLSPSASIIGNTMFRPPVNVKSPYPSRRSICSTTSITSEEVAACTNAVEEKLNLEEELFRLRESTKAALQQSWDEVETLQQQCAAHLQFTSELEGQLMEARKNEDSWRVRCLAAEVRLHSSPENEDNQLTANNKPNLRETMLAWTRVPNLEISSWNSDRNLSMTQTPGESEKSADTQKDDQIKRLLLKLSSRDEAIISLEQTLEQHVKAMQYTQAETLCSMETQRIKEKHQSESHRRQEVRLEKVVEFHRKKLIARDACIEVHQKKLSDYRIYIEELTLELAKVLRVVQDVEEKGGSLDYHVSHSKNSRVTENTKDSVHEDVSCLVDIPCNENISNKVTEKTKDSVPEAVSLVLDIRSNGSVLTSESLTLE